MALVLLVDDERSIRMTFGHALMQDGHEVITAESAEEAWAILRMRPIDVMVSDIIMPGMHGVALLEMLTEESIDTEAILMTGYPSAETAIRAIRAGAFDYLPKPVYGSTLRRVVGAAHSRKLLRAEQASEQDACASYLQQLTEVLAENLNSMISKLEAKSAATLPLNGSWRQEILSCLAESHDCIELLACELSNLHEKLSPEVPGVRFQGSVLTKTPISHLVRCAPRPPCADGEQIAG
jgi:DNA-binding NtrC family response regulator